MDYALEERIGNPDLFTGRKKELAYYLKWLNDIKEKKSQSTAMLARRKTGKTAIMERLFNITFYKNDGVIPFYYEIKEVKMWVGDFCKDFFLTFIYQYIAFKARKSEYLDHMAGFDFDKVADVAQKEGLHYLIDLIEGVKHEYTNEYVDTLWTLVRDAPRRLAARQGEFIIQMIDEFQFLNAKIYRDKKLKNLQDDMAGGYLSTAESKVAPLLVSGSWVGWLMKELNTMLPARFRYKYLKNMPEDEAIEMVYKYSRFFEVPVTEETAFLLSALSEGSPFYLSAVIRSGYPDKNLTTLDGLTRTLEFETLDEEGTIKSTWMEYVSSAFPQINARNAKHIVLHLCKHRDRELTREELLKDLKLDMSDAELEKKLKALVKADIITQGSSNFRYHGVKDNIFDKVFRGVYEEEIQEFDVRQIRQEYNREFEKQRKQYLSLLGKHNYQKGYFAEYVILDQLQFHAIAKNELLKSITKYLPIDFNFCDYSRVWRYHSSPEYQKNFSVDIYARSRAAGDYSIIGEVKCRESKKFSRDEAAKFLVKLKEIKKMENLESVTGFVFSRTGFTKDAETYCRENGIACSDDERWLATE
ncbi:MAG: hypothetical protein GY757_40850 [bacterium]|nr:hypothetical protein [bacterium]